MVAGGLFDRSGYLSLDAEGNVVPSPEALAFTHGPDGAPGEPERPSNGMDSASQDAVLLGADVADRTSPSMLSGMGSKPDRNILGGYDPEHAAKVTSKWLQLLYLLYQPHLPDTRFLAASTTHMHVRPMNHDAPYAHALLIHHINVVLTPWATCRCCPCSPRCWHLPRTCLLWLPT